MGKWKSIRMLKVFWVKIAGFWKRYKWWIISIGIAVYITFFDSNSLLRFYKVQRDISVLEARKRELVEQIKQDSLKLMQLKTNNKTFERFARETYFFHKPDEDVYVIKVKK